MVREPRVGRREGRAMPFGCRAIRWSMIVGTLPGDRARGLPVEAIAGHIRDVAARLVAGGRLVLTFRDLSGELCDLDRVIPLYASDELVMTCFLEYEPSTVKVHDLIWVRQQDGWRFRKGVYRKLRLAPEAVTVRLEQAGFTVERHQALAGMVALVGVSVGQRRF